MSTSGICCSIYGCHVSRRSKYKGISIFKVPSGASDFETNWRNKLVAVVTSSRVIDSSLREQIEKKRVYICQQHFRPDQYLVHDTCKTLKPGEIPTLNLPVKSIPSSSQTISSPRPSAQLISKKKEISLSSSTSSSTVSFCYKSYEDFKKRIELLKLPSSWDIVYSANNNEVIFKYFDNLHSIAKYEIHTNESLIFKLRYFSWMIPEEHNIYLTYSSSFKNITVSNLIKIITGYHLCNGITAVKNSYLSHTVPKIFSLSEFNAASSPLHQSVFYRHPSCAVFLEPGSSKCIHCIDAEKKELISLNKREKKLLTPAKLNAPIKHTDPERVKLTMQNIRLENKLLKSEIEKMKNEIVNKSIDLKDQSLHNDFVKIMSDADTSRMPPFMKFFWEEQQKYLSANKTGVRYHPMIIRYCLGLAAKSPAFYDDIRYDKNNETGILMLPSRRRLRDYKNYIRPTQGFNKDVIKELVKITENFSNEERYCLILHDEMKIQEDLVWDKHTGHLIGYVDLGDVELNYAALKKTDDIASHVLVFLIRSIVNPLKFTVANFATKSVTAPQLFVLFWKAVGVLEDANLKVMAVTSDGASANRTMYQMHEVMKHSVITSYQEKNIVYKTKNRHAPERDLYFICDVPHVIKTARNNLSHSGFDKTFSRLLWNDGNYLTWGHIKDLMLDDLENGLQLCPKITTEHLNLSAFSVMNVRLAAQVLSTSVSVALKEFGTAETSATAKYCQMFDNFFDCLNVRNTKECTHKIKPFLQPYTSVSDERFKWLMETFLPYFNEWQSSIKFRPGGPFSKTDMSKMFISWQTHEALIITTHSVIDLIQYLLNNQVKYVLTERFCQDPLENYFGRQRSMGRRRDNPNLRTFGYQDNTIRTCKTFRPIAGNSRKDEQETFAINSDPLLSRRNKRKNLSGKEDS